MTHQAEVVTYPCRNVTVVCDNTYLDLVSYLEDTKIRFNCKLNLTSVIGDFSESQHLASYVSRHNAMAYDYDTCPHK
jgi:hypothetical protein